MAELSRLFRRLSPRTPADGRRWDERLEIARAVTPESACATKVKLDQFRWTCGVTWPKRYRTKAAEPETPPQVQSYLFKHDRLQVREDGAQRVDGGDGGRRRGLRRAPAQEGRGAGTLRRGDQQNSRPLGQTS